MTARKRRSWAPTSDPIEPYRELMQGAWAEARTRAFGDPVQKAREAASRSDLEKYATRPVGFVREYLGERTWPGSRATLRSLVTHQKTLACGCRKSTKSHTCAQAITWKFSTKRSRIIVTSATYTQMRENIFARVRHLHARARKPLPGRCGVTSLRQDPTWFVIGMSTNKPGNTMGFHADVSLPAHLEYDSFEVDEDSLLPPDPELADLDARRAERDAGEVIDEEVWRAKKDQAEVFFALDEMAEIRADIIEAMMGSWMGEFVHVLGQFNPTFPPDSNHAAARALRTGSGWHRIHIAGREPPTESHPDGMFDECYHGVPKELMPDAWVEERAADWGRESALFHVHVLGLPANVERESQFIPFRILRDQFDRVIKDPGRVSARHIGWDVAASEKGDHNVCQLWVNGVLTDEEKWRDENTIRSAERVLELRHRWGVGGEPIPGRNIHVDKTGVGKGPSDFMRSRGVRVDAVDFGAAPQYHWTRLIGEQQFVNVKAELLWVLRCALATGLAHIPKRFSDTVRQAQWYTIGETPGVEGTKFKCKETREQIVKLFGRSPDELSAAMLAWSRGGQLPTFGVANSLSDVNRLLNG